MTDSYYRKDFVKAEFVMGIGWYIRRYNIESDKWSDSVLLPDDIFKKLYIKDEEPSVASSQQNAINVEERIADAYAAAYAVTVDGFIAIKHRAIRNLHSPFIVWMPEAVWLRLANCATAQGQFYIPCTETIQSPEQLRALVKQEQENVI